MLSDVGEKYTKLNEEINAGYWERKRKQEERLAREKQEKKALESEISTTNHHNHLEVSHLCLNK